MALGALSLSVTQGVQGRPFAAKINGLTTGKVEVLVDGTPGAGFGTSNGILRSPSLPPAIGTVTVVLREYEPGASPSFRDSRIEIASASTAERRTQALAAIPPGRTLNRFRTAGTAQSDGSLVYSIYAEDDLGATAVVAVGVAPAPTPTLISATTRMLVPQASSAATYFGALSVAAYSYDRFREKAARAVTGAQMMIFNGAITVSNNLPAYINSARQEQGCGTGLTFRGNIITSPITTTAQAADTGGVANTARWSGVAAQASIGTKPGVDQLIYKIDNSTTPPQFVPRTYAQMVADNGGNACVTASTVNSSSLANSQIIVPDGYLVIADQGPNIATGAYYYPVLESSCPAVTLSSVTVSGDATTITLQCTAAPDARIQVGNIGTLRNATGNTTVNATWRISAIDRTANTITLTTAGSGTITTGAVTGTPLFSFARPSGGVFAQVTLQPMNDWQRGSGAQVDCMGSTSLANVNGGTNSAIDGGALITIAGILGTDPTGGECYLIHGDSIAAFVGDRSTNGLTGNIQGPGDADGAMSFAGRAFNTAGLPTFKVAVPGMKAETGVTNGDDQFRRFMAGFCDTMFNEMGHNDGGNLTFITAMNGNYKAALRGRKRVVQCTMTVTSTVGTSNNFQNRAGQVLTAPFTYPGGAIYTTTNPTIRALGANNDAYVDLEAFSSYLDGGTTIDGKWPADGTSFKFTVEGAHPSKDGHIGIAAQLTPAILKTALGTS